MACYTDGEPPKQKIRVVLPWASDLALVLHNGEHCLPCPECERPNGVLATDEFMISSWDNLSTRLHLRLRQHYARFHGKPLKDVLEPEDVRRFYARAHSLRCQLLHGPPLPTSAVAPMKATKFLCPPEAEQNIEKQPETVRTAHERMRNLSGLKGNSAIPPSFLDWLKTDADLASATIGSYLVAVRNFLGWLLEHKTTNLTLCHSWNLEWVKAFLDAVHAASSAPTTVYNYACAMNLMQRYTLERGEVSPSERDKAQWAQLMRRWGKLKKAHQRKVGDEKLENTPTLSEVRRRIIESESTLAKFKELVDLSRVGDFIGPSEFKWATGFAILQLQASNFKRNGNLSKIKIQNALPRLSAAVDQIKQGKERVCVSFEVKDATKTGGREIFSMVDPRKIMALYQYAKFIRPRCPREVKADDLFLNSVGTALKTKVSDVIQAVAKGEGMKGVVIRDLRSRVETTAAAHASQIDRPELARHLAHSENTRDRFYLHPTAKRSRRAAEDLEELLQIESSSDEESACGRPPPPKRKCPTIRHSASDLSLVANEDLDWEPQRKPTGLSSESDSDNGSFSLKGSSPISVSSEGQDPPPPLNDSSRDRVPQDKVNDTPKQICEPSTEPAQHRVLRTRLVPVPEFPLGQGKGKGRGKGRGRGRGKATSQVGGL